MTKFKEILSILANLTNENTGEEQINQIAKGQAILEELEQDSESMKEEITRLKKDKIGYVKRLGAYKQQESDENNNEKSLDEIIKEVANNYYKENFK